MDKKPYPANIADVERQFFLQLLSYDRRVLCYEDDVLQTQALSVMPVQTFEFNVDKLITNSKELMDNNMRKDLLLLELLRWFKEDFFSWMNSPKCKKCDTVTVASSLRQEPTVEDLEYEGNRVESYQCPQCGEYERFVRYNHPGKLLETRTGRCGEWANCFTLCARALGFETRFVLDMTDHVWTEVYSQHKKRWLHCDPCENTCDKSLLYERGWGKKLTYCVAFSVEETVDVSWRYSADHKSLLQRRLECTERGLIQFIYKCNQQKQRFLPPDRKLELANRSVVELVEFISPRRETDKQECAGRTSGDLTWRLARGETQLSPSSTPTGSFIFKPYAKDTQTYAVKYCASKDEYYDIDGSAKTIKGWSSCVFSAHNVARKEERDWKMVYLARDQDSGREETAIITWKFDFSDISKQIDSISIRISTQCFENGQITCTLCSGDLCTRVAQNEPVIINDFRGSSCATLSIEMRGGRGDCAWQHTQLFRQKINDDSCMFEITFQLL